MKTSETARPSSAGAYQRVTFPRSPEAEEALFESGMLGAEESDENLIAFFSAAAVLSPELLALNPEIEIIETEDWTRIWRENLRPVNIGTFVVVPPELEEETPENGRIRLVIEPGLAFGTGDHPTTRASLGLLSRYVAPGDTVLDFGSGSGILGIAAFKLGAKKVVCVENDAVARRCAAENAERNGAELELLEKLPDRLSADVVVANIESGVLEVYLPRLKEICRPGGKIILSGILRNEDFPAETPAGYVLDGEWKTVELNR